MERKAISFYSTEKKEKKNRREEAKNKCFPSKSILKESLPPERPVEFRPFGEPLKANLRICTEEKHK